MIDIHKKWLDYWEECCRWGEFKDEDGKLIFHLYENAPEEIKRKFQYVEEHKLDEEKQMAKALGMTIDEFLSEF